MRGSDFESWAAPRAAIGTLAFGVVAMTAVTIFGIWHKTASPHSVSYASQTFQVWQYPVKGIRVVDGDTAEVSLDLGFGVEVTRMLRVDGVDTPEKNTNAGKAVKACVERWVNAGSPLVACYHKDDKFGGRFDGDLISSGGTRLSTFLIDNSIAREYHGERKEPWTESQLSKAEKQASQLP